MFSDEINNKLEKLAILNDYRWAIAVATDFIIITVVVAASIHIDNFFIYILSIVIIGSRQRALATILHDAAHRVLCENIVLNDFIGRYLSGYLIFQSFDNYVRSHVISHHNSLGNPKKDPDYQFYLQSGLFDNDSKTKFIIKHLIAPFFLSKSIPFIKYIIKNRLGKPFEKSFYKIVIYWVFMVSLAIYFEYIDILFAYWIIPLLTTFPMLSWFIEMSEHYPMILEKDELYQTRNRFSSSLETFFTGIHGENFHLTHHLMPNIPFYNIKKAHLIMMEDKEYRKVNLKMGGIFFSQKNYKSMWKDILLSDFKKTIKAI